MDISRLLATTKAHKEVGTEMDPAQCPQIDGKGTKKNGSAIYIFPLTTGGFSGTYPLSRAVSVFLPAGFSSLLSLRRSSFTLFCVLLVCTGSPQILVGAFAGLCRSRRVATAVTAFCHALLFAAATTTTKILFDRNKDIFIC